MNFSIVSWRKFAFQAVYVKKWILLSTLFLSLASAQSQDIGSEEHDSGIQTEFILQDPYRLTLKLRPLSYFLLPMTGGRMGSFNARVDYAFHRRFTLGLEANYFYARPWQGFVTVSDLFSIRLDPTFYLFKESNPYRYAEGFHIGGYYKYKYDDTYDPTLIQTFGQSRVISNSHILGAMLGFQIVKGKYLVDQSMGVGLGLCTGSAGTYLIPDFRLGLSFGTVLLQ